MLNDNILLLKINGVLLELILYIEAKASTSFGVRLES